MSTTSFKRRIVAATGALALGLLGAIGVSSAAFAADAVPGDINPDAQGSITIYKYEEAGNTNPGDPAGDGLPGMTPLEGVEFTVTPVPGVDLTTNAGWDAVPGLTAANATGVPVVMTTDVDGKAVFANLPVGVYYVEETGHGGNDIVDSAAPFFVTIPLPTDAGWLYDVSVYPKNTVAGATKTIEETSGLGLNSIITYNISVKIPTLAAGANFTAFSVVDNVPGGLDTASATAAPAGAQDFLTVAGNTVTFGDPAAVSPELNTWLKAHAGETLVLTITARVSGVGAFVNSANVTVNDWTATPSATTRWGAIEVLKTDVNQSNLAGAVFSVYASEADAIAGTNPISVAGSTTFTSDGTGPVSIAGLFVGDSNDGVTARDYWVREHVAPVGYVIAPGEVSGTPGIFKVNVVEGAPAGVELTVVNTRRPAVQLPLTGANGELLMTIGGISLVLVAAGAAMIQRRNARR